MLQESFDSASLEDFWTALLERGFEPQAGSARSRWRGPISPAFHDLTDAQTMDIVFNPGWPYQPPAVLVDGLDTSHYMLNGFVCLWRDGDASLQWITVEGLFERIKEWCAKARNNWIDDDLPFDAYLNFQKKAPYMAVFDFDSLRTSPGSWGEFHGNPSPDRALIELLPGAAIPKQTPTRHVVPHWNPQGCAATSALRIVQTPQQGSAKRPREGPFRQKDCRAVQDQWRCGPNPLRLGTARAD